MDQWGDLDRRRLVQARQANGESQAACAVTLKRLGCAGASQGVLSRWETGKIERPRADTVTILRKYIADALGDVTEPAKDPDDAASEAADTEEFEGFVRSFTNEPLLGPRQGAFVDAQIERIRTGPPLSDADQEARIDLLKLLGL